MSAIQFIFLFSMLGAGPAPRSLEPPAAPEDFKQARLQGLHRLSAAELKQLANDFLTRGVATMGTENFMAVPRIDATNDTYCYAPTSTRKTAQDEESCFAVFRTADGARYFGYDINERAYPRVWRSFRE
jgi:hypothetical protein